MTVSDDDPAPADTPSALRAGCGAAARADREIVLRGAAEHNLKGFDLRIPRRSLTVVTGVSGSGKSSLAFDTLFREGQRRFLETLPSFARQFVGGFARPALTSVEGLGPAVAVGQRTSHTNPRSTVGTLTEVWDLLRLLFARLGSAPEGVKPTRGLFSFNGAEGACPDCQGLGVEDRLDLDLLVADPAKSLRDRALRVSTPNGYLMYSQVTLDVLDQVLKAHGGSVDTPWRELSDEARQVVLYGSDRLKIPYGKHPLESRLKWTGITPRPRQEGVYRGLVPVMEEILRGKRNDSILRFVRSSSCRGCGGARLRPEALAVTWRGKRIVDLASLTPRELGGELEAPGASPAETAVLEPIRADIVARSGLMVELGLGYLAFDRPAPTLSRGEAQRLRLLGMALGELRGLLVVLDEPSAGLHPHDVGRLIRVLRRLRDQGQTLVVVEHDAAIARSADWLVDLGPGPGREGGELLFSGPPSELLGRERGEGGTPTERWLAGREPTEFRPPRRSLGTLHLEGLCRNNLRQVSFDLELGVLNLVSGVSGAGKSSLLEEAVARFRGGQVPGAPFRRIVTVDAEPIGRTPRSNAATYTGAFDLIRDLFAATPDAKRKGLGKGHFSFNTAGGRCEGCEGAGVREVGMRYLGSVDLVCETCGGKRFHSELLEVKYRGRNIADLLEGSIAEAAELFADAPKLRRILEALLEVGLGYLPLGQPATTLSGGEAQRVKLATELARAGSGAALVVLDEPTTGLHAADVEVLLAAWNRLLEAGHTLLVVDNDPDVVRSADRITDLGPGSGPEGGRVVASGAPEAIAACADSLTGGELLRAKSPVVITPPLSRRAAAGEGEIAEREGTDSGPRSREDFAGLAGHIEADDPPMELLGVSTHNLREIDVAIPARGLTVVTGPSGCGKSSLVFDTLLVEASNRFADLVSPWARRLLPRKGGAELAGAKGLQATVAVPQSAGRRNPRSTVGTATELDELLRLLYARGGQRPCRACGEQASGERCACGGALPSLWASSFSPNSDSGACPLCRGLGFVQRCDPERLVGHPERALDAGAMEGTRFGAYLGEPEGQFVATLRSAAAHHGLDLSPPWRDLGPRERRLAMYGTGGLVYDVEWRYKRGKREGVHHLRSAWEGFVSLVDREYERIHADGRSEELEPLLADLPCEGCGGERLREEVRGITFGGLRLPELSRLPVEAARKSFETLENEAESRNVLPAIVRLTVGLRREIASRLVSLCDAGLGYLSLDREMASLSGGEAQRVRLAAALGGGLVGVTYVLDEPTQGLHARDVERLRGVLRGLAEAGNAVVLVEHEPSLVGSADHLVELGPGAGPEGGRLVASGTPEQLKRIPGSRTGALLRRWETRGAPRSKASLAPGLKVLGASLHNLRDLDVTFPAGGVVAVTGVSGSGKSTLVLDVLAPSLRNLLQGRSPSGCRGIELHAGIRELIAAGQEAMGVAGGSSVATLAGLAEPLRRRFAATSGARARKLTARHFSTAAPGGRCETCEGRGVIVVAMDLLPDVAIGCEACQGRRFRPEVLECRLDGRNIAEMLDAGVAELAEAFAADPHFAKPTKALIEVGLGYLRLGQSGGSLSAGELQRLRLAGLLADPGGRKGAVLLDEPTRGLGFEDVDRLVEALRRLAKDGHLVVAVEHDLDFIAASDWVIDLGPEGGEGGGRIVYEGPPERLPLCAESHTGRALFAGRT
jgi:excinuclease ABC subunit A